MSEGVAAPNVHQAVERRRAGALVDANGQVVGLGLFIDREKVGVVQGAVPLNAPEEESRCAVGGAKLDLLHGGLDVPQGRNECPVDPARALGANLRHVAVVGLAKGDFQVRVVGEVGQKQRGKDDLRFRPKPVHLGNPGVQVRHVPRAYVRHFLDKGLLNRRDEEGAAPPRRAGKDMAVDKPHMVGLAVDRVGRHLHNHRPAGVKLRVQLVPHSRGFRNVRVGVIDSWHGVPPLPTALFPVVALSVCSIRRRLSSVKAARCYSEVTGPARTGLYLVAAACPS